MAKSWTDMVNEAKAQVTRVSPAEAYECLQDNPEALLIEVRDPESVPMEDRAPNVTMISLGSLPMRADLEIAERLRDPRFLRYRSIAIADLPPMLTRRCLLALPVTMIVWSRRSRSSICIPQTSAARTPVSYSTITMAASRRLWGVLQPIDLTTASTPSGR